MKKYVTLFIVHLLLINVLNAQNKITHYTIAYSKYNNGQKIENQDKIIVDAHSFFSEISTESIKNHDANYPYETTYVNTDTNKIEYSAFLDVYKTIYTQDSTSLKSQKFELLPETKIILGYTCKKARTSINSNTIDLWYTNELGVIGAPNTLGQKLGLVLEYNRNNTFSIIADKIVKNKPMLIKPVVSKSDEYVDLVTYKDLIWKSRFKTIEVFKDEIVNFSSESKSNDSILRFANGTILLKKISFPFIKKGSSVFAEVKEQSNGDAYDRTGSFFIIPQEKQQSFFDGLQKGVQELPIYTNENGKNYQGIVATNKYEPIIELIRFFTPFGIQHFNHLELKDKKWFDIVSYRQDISELKSNLSNKDILVGIFIGNYDKGGHKVSATITIHNEENNNEINLQAIPLFCTTNIMEMAGQEYGTLFSSEKGLQMTFKLEKELKNCRLRYIATGHGGWEQGDEFVPKVNTILLDDKVIAKYTPWRQDCGSYRLYNPASGNFPNGLSSSDYSRANWCPGTATYPVYFELGNLSAGNHTIQITIPQGRPEGSSFSSWNISGVLLGEQE